MSAPRSIAKSRPYPLPVEEPGLLHLPSGLLR